LALALVFHAIAEVVRARAGHIAGHITVESGDEGL
jgi:hypothetical protein